MAQNSSSDVFMSRPDVDFKDEALEIMGRLLGNTKQLDVISIVGMAGLGKTTLALKVYNDESIAHHFDVLKWITVSQTYQKRDLLLTMLGSRYTHSSGETDKISDAKLGEQLYKSLKGNRYLIVMDDIWSSQAWDDLKRSFPNDNNGSRVMFTTRIKDVSFHAKSKSIPYDLRFLSEEESWDLLKEKIFHTEMCPLELVEVGKKIAKKCQGLPLAIVVIGGLLAKNEKNEYFWKQVAESMGSYIASDPKQCIEALELSYNHLPNHLKPLFLYLGAFPEDYEIPVMKLIWLWIAEGFVKKNAAVDYLSDLIGRSLILISKRSSNGEVKSCRVHDLLRDMCLRKAEEENFMQIIDRYALSSPILPSSYSSRFVENKVCRLSINCNIDQYFSFKHFPNASTILIHGTYSSTLRMGLPMSFSHFRLLKVLDLKDARCQINLSGIEYAVHLRYLALKKLSRDLAQTIPNLQNLETLIFSIEEGKKPIKFDISNMVNLSHLKIIDPMAHVEVLLADLQSTPKLRRLKCSFSTTSILSSSLGLESLVKLETLRMHYQGLPSMVRWLDLPTTLKEIALSNFGFDWRDFSKLARLPNLEILKLLFNSFRGECWGTSLEYTNLQFPKLKFLKFQALNIVEWNASRDHFPSLRRLVLNSCLQLKEIPSDIGDIPTLEMIELIWCSSSVAQSVRQILEEQQGMGNEQLKISINPPESQSYLISLP